MKTVSQIVEELNSEKEKRSERVLKESSRRKFESGLFSNLENNLSKNTFDVEVKNQVKLPDIFKIDGEVWVKDTSAILANLKKIIGEISDLKNKSVSQTKSLEKNLKPEKVDFSDLEKAVKGMLEPEFREIKLGAAEVLAVFKISKVGNIAGCKVLNGELRRNGRARIMRNGTEVYNGEISSLKHEKDDVREVRTGFECGISLRNFNAFEVGDLIECYAVEKVN